MHHGLLMKSNTGLLSFFSNVKTVLNIILFFDLAVFYPNDSMPSNFVFWQPQVRLESVPIISNLNFSRLHECWPCRLEAPRQAKVFLRHSGFLAACHQGFYVPQEQSTLKAWIETTYSKYHNMI
jgi:hypothetical protein